MPKPSPLVAALLDGPFVLRKRPAPMLGDLRRAFGIAIMVLILGASRGKKASLQKLHFLAHSIRTPKTRAEVMGVFSGSTKPSQIHVRVEPWVNRALSFARAAQLITFSEQGKNARLTEKGVAALEEITTGTDLLTEEKGFLQAVGPHATEARIERIMRMESLL